MNQKKNSIVPGGLFEISKSDEKKLDVYEDYPKLYKKYYFLYYGKKIMTYTMVKKSPFKFPTERYLNIVKRGYKDCNLEKKLDVYEDFPILYKKYYFYYYGKKVMTYTMVRKTSFRYPTERYLNVVKRGYKDCNLDKKYLKKALCLKS